MTIDVFIQAIMKTTTIHDFLRNKPASGSKRLTLVCSDQSVAAPEITSDNKELVDRLSKVVEQPFVSVFSRYPRGLDLLYLCS